VISYFIKKLLFYYLFFKRILIEKNEAKKFIGDWGLGIGDWGLGVGGLGQNPQPPTHNPQPHNPKIFFFFFKIIF